MSGRLGCAALGLALACISSPAHSQGDELARRVTAIVAERWHVAPERLHLEWRLPLPTGGPADSVVGSLIPRPAGWWTVIAPADATMPQRAVRIGVVDSVRVARRAIARDAVITPDDFADTVVVRWGPPSRASTLRPQAGWVARRLIAEGEELHTPSIAPAPLIGAGDSVTVVYEQGDMGLSLRAVATRRAASVGDRLEVRFADGRLLAVTAAAPKTVHPIVK